MTFRVRSSSRFREIRERLELDQDLRELLINAITTAAAEALDNF
jgi:hypothetical protein